VVYLKGDTTFNESFATTVEREGVKRWLQSIDQSELLIRAQQDQLRQTGFLELVLGYQEQFDQLYAQDLSDDYKRLEKQALQRAYGLSVFFNCFFVTFEVAIGIASAQQFLG
jgi:predicted aminopeptidase